MSVAVESDTEYGLDGDAQSDAFHELLVTLAGALDIRDVFRRLSAVAARVLPHNEANLALLTEDGARYRLYASTRDGEPELVCPGEHPALDDPSVPRLFGPAVGFLES